MPEPTTPAKNESKKDDSPVAVYLAALHAKHDIVWRARAKKPDDASILNYLGYSLADRGLKLDAAKEFIERAVRLDGQNPAYQDSLGWVYFKLGRSTEAVAELSSAAEKIADDATVWDHLGDASAANGKPARSTSIPRVGSSNSNTFGDIASHLASTTFC